MNMNNMNIYILTYSYSTSTPKTPACPDRGGLPRLCSAPNRAGRAAGVRLGLGPRTGGPDDHPAAPEPPLLVTVPLLYNVVSVQNLLNFCYKRLV